MRRPLLTLCVLAALTFAAGLGRPAITDADEAYYAEAAREMLSSGDWLTPRFNFVDRWQKPVLYYWLTAATYAAAGPVEWAARAWSAAAGIGLALLTWAIARRHLRDHPAPDAAAWMAGAIVATSFGYVAMARSALPDLPLACCITATIAAALWASEPRGQAQGQNRQHALWLAAGCAAGCGFLMKGPVAVVVPAVVLAPIWFLERGRVHIPASGLAVAAASGAAIGLPWYLAMTATHGVPYLQSFFVADNLERFTTARFNDPRPLWFYPAVIGGGMLPWTFFGVAPAARAMRQRLAHLAGGSPLYRRLVLWAVCPLALFMASVGQQPRYVLPVLPPLAVLLASALTRHVHTRSALLRAPALATAFLLFGLAAALIRLRPMLITAPPVAPWLGALALAGSGLWIGTVALTGRWPALPRALVAGAAAVVLAVQLGALSGRRPEAVEEMASAVLRHRQAAEPVGPYRVFVRNLVFYTRTQQVDLFDEASAVRFLQTPARVLLVASARDVAVLAQRSGVEVTELARVRYLNTANLRLDALVRPDPAAQLEEVVLVTNR